MDTALWIIQGLLAFAFAGAGAMKLMTPYEKLIENEQMAWANDFSPNIIKVIGGLEIAGAIGLILPMALDIAPVLTPLAAAGLVLTMFGAAFTHYRRGEMGAIAPNMVLLVLAAVVALGRVAAEGATVV